MKKSTLVKLTAAFFGILAVSTATYAADQNVSTARECSLGTFCPLSQPGDISSFTVFKHVATSYNCTLYGGASKGKGRNVTVRLTSAGTFNLKPTIFSTKEGSSTKTTVKGTFVSNNAGKLVATRIADNIENPVDVRIMCNN